MQKHATKTKSSLSCLQLRSKALRIYEHLYKQDNVAEPDPFQVSKARHDNFIQRQKLHNMKVRGESAGTDHKADAHIPFFLRISTGVLNAFSVCARFSQSMTPT